VSSRFRAAKHGNSTLTKLLLIHGAKINTKDLDNRTPLHDAAASGHTRTVMVLLEDKSIQIDSIDHDGNTPLVLAILNGYVQAYTAM
jgi:ankyrin repeat protein